MYCSLVAFDFYSLLCHGSELSTTGRKCVNGRIAKSEDPLNGIPRVTDSSPGQVSHLAHRDTGVER
jgi:hypothetical protein